MKRIYKARGPLDGAMMRELLRVSGIQAEVYERTVWIVHDSDEARAARILGLRRTLPRPSSPRRNSAGHLLQGASVR